MTSAYVYQDNANSDATTGLCMDRAKEWINLSTTPRSPIPREIHPRLIFKNVQRQANSVYSTSHPEDTRLLKQNSSQRLARTMRYKMEHVNNAKWSALRNEAQRVESTRGLATNSSAAGAAKRNILEPPRDNSFRCNFRRRLKGFRKQSPGNGSPRDSDLAFNPQAWAHAAGCSVAVSRSIPAIIAPTEVLADGTCSSGQIVGQECRRRGSFVEKRDQSPR